MTQHNLILKMIVLIRECQKFGEHKSVAFRFSALAPTGFDFDGVQILANNMEKKRVNFHVGTYFQCRAEYLCDRKNSISACLPSVFGTDL